MDVALEPGEFVRVFLDAPVMVDITADEIMLFDGGDAGRVLWRKPLDPAEAEITRALQTPGR